MQSRLISMHKAPDSRGPPSSPPMRSACSCSERYARATDRYVEVMGRRDPGLVKTNGPPGAVKGQPGETAWNESNLEAGAKKLTSEINRRLGGSGFTVKMTTEDFDLLSAAAFDTYAVWVSDDPPPP